MPAPASVQVAPFGRTPDGTAVELYTLRNRHGITVRIMTYGGVVTELWTPDREGRMANICLGFQSLAPYLDRSPYFGALIGRYANRIAHGRFRTPDGEWSLARNNGEHHLHGGARGFDKVVWAAEGGVHEGAACLRLRRTSPDGEEGYPGQLEVEALYALTEDDELRLTFSARTGRITPVSLTNHAYFNLGGVGSGTILGHELTIHAEHYTPVDGGLIPTGELRPVAGTAFDFRSARPLGAGIADPDEQLRHGGGYDHNFVLAPSDAVRLAAHARDPRSGRTLTLSTDAPGLQLYSGNFLDGSNGFPLHGAFCLEPQQFPDAPNQPHFPAPWLRPGDTYRAHHRYRFGLG